jgi:hypothetical protein
LGIDYNCGGVQDYFNDCYIVNTSDGVPPTDFPGDLRSIALFPVSPAGSESGWTPSNGSGPNYLMVNEKPNDGDVTFVTTNSNVTDTYHFPVIALPTGSHIFGIQNNVVARKDESGERKISSVCRPGSGTDYVGTPVSNPNYVDLSIGDSYATYPWMWNHNPDTGNDWLESEYNNTQFGEKCTL